MSQDYQSIGNLSPEQQAVPRDGWQGDVGQPLADSRQDPNVSRWSLRANRQELAAGGDASYADDFFSPDGQGDTITNMPDHAEDHYSTTAPGHF